MLKVLRILAQQSHVSTTFKRTFLSQAYYCNEVWDHRLNDQVLQKVKFDEMYYLLEQKYQKTRQMSAVDVDVYVNALKDEDYVDETLDLVHKLRLTADTVNTLDSTSHAVVRYLNTIGETERLQQVLDDRLNYGVFLDHYTANVLMDTYWKQKNFVAGAQVASQLMLQEDVDHSLYATLALLHCYHFLLKPEGWKVPPPPEEPEEEVKVRVNYLRNPYFDDHFDLREPLAVVGKTLVALTKGKDDLLKRSFHLCGLALWNKPDKAKELINAFEAQNKEVCDEIINLLPEDNEIRVEAKKLQKKSQDVSILLQEEVKAAERAVAEKDISKQCEVFSKWEDDRRKALEAQKEKLLRIRRIAEIEEAQRILKEKETKLWFFENQEKMELQIEEEEALMVPEEQAASQKQSAAPKAKDDENYVPPEIVKKRPGQ